VESYWCQQAALSECIANNLESEDLDETSIGFSYRSFGGENQEFTALILSSLPDKGSRTSVYPNVIGIEALFFDRAERRKPSLFFDQETSFC